MNEQNHGVAVKDEWDLSAQLRELELLKGFTRADVLRLPRAGMPPVQRVETEPFVTVAEVSSVEQSDLNEPQPVVVVEETEPAEKPVTLLPGQNKPAAMSWVKSQPLKETVTFYNEGEVPEMPFEKPKSRWRQFLDKHTKPKESVQLAETESVPRNRSRTRRLLGIAAVGLVLVGGAAFGLSKCDNESHLQAGTQLTVPPVETTVTTTSLPDTNETDLKVKHGVQAAQEIYGQRVAYVKLVFDQMTPRDQADFAILSAKIQAGESTQKILTDLSAATQLENFS